MLKTLWTSVLQPIVAWVQAHWSQISTVAKVVFIAVAVAAKILLTAIKLAFDGITLTIKATVAVIRWMNGAVRAVWDAVKTAVTAVKNWIVARFNDVIGFFRGIPGKIASVAVHLWDSYRNAATSAKTWVVARFTDVVNFVKGLPGKIATAARGMWDGIKTAFKTVINWIIDGWNGIQFKIPGFHIGPVGYGGFTLGLPDIQHLAKAASPPARRWRWWVTTRVGVRRSCRCLERWPRRADGVGDPLRRGAHGRADRPADPQVCARQRRQRSGSPRPVTEKRVTPTVQMYVNSAWTDISSYAAMAPGDSISIIRGRQDEASAVQTSVCTLKLNNKDGRFTPRNPTGPYYGLIGRNTPLRVQAPGLRTL